MNMDESDNKSNMRQLLSARNLILAAAAVLVLSVVGSCLSMLRPNDSDGLARDSFGVTGDGYRALLETLEALNVPVARNLAPPRPSDTSDETLVLLRPDPMLVGHGPRYLRAILDWVEAGGRLAVAPTDWNRHWARQYTQSNPNKSPTEHDILKLLGVADQIELEEYVPDDNASLTASPSTPSPSTNDESTFSEKLSGFFAEKSFNTTLEPATCSGSLAPLAADVAKLALPAEVVTALKVKPDVELTGAITARAPQRFHQYYSNEQLTLIALIPSGQGEIVIVSDPLLLANAYLAKADNSVLAARLLSPNGERVIFDEFYHGLAVRGNALYLLTRPGFAAVTLGLLAVVGVWTWRKAVFLGPPLEDAEPSRRDIGQYIDAMGAFLGRGPDHRRFLVRETRDGVLQQLCQELRLPPDTASVDTILAALVRRDPERADSLRRTLQQIDATLADRREYPKSDYLPAMQKLAGCL